MTNFIRTHQFLRAQRIKGQAGIILALAVLFGSWGLWVVRGTLSMYVVSDSARLEVRQLPVKVQSSVSGEIELAQVQLGQFVSKGQVLVRLDTRVLVLSRAELETAVRTGETAIGALKAGLAAEEGVRGAVAQVAKHASLTATARVSLNQKALFYKQEEFVLGERLREAALISGIEALRTMADTEAQRATVTVSEAQAGLERATSSMNLREREARLAEVRINLAQATAEQQQWDAQIDSIDHEIERRTVRAAASGVIADVISLSHGMTIEAGQAIASIVQPGPVHVVAYFAPQQSNGRLRVGQRATLRLDAYPWTQFGTAAGTVSAVGMEPRDGLLRVELSVDESAAPNLPLKHGMTGSCEVEVDTTSPLGLLLRAMASAVSPEPRPMTSRGGA